jgi:hypothetical protein
MKLTLISRVRFLLLLLIVAIPSSAKVCAQAVRFVQITDPHLFDLGQEGTDNITALAASIKKTNDRQDDGANYLFAIITGDIGIESLVTIGKNQNGDNILERDRAKVEQRIEQGAVELASILSQSKIRVWLLLPGNNDLINEEPDTQYYRLFVQKLRNALPAFEVIDLCPEEPQNDKQQLGVYRLGPLAFIGFNNASFKNNNLPERIAKYKNLQLNYVRQVAARLAGNDIRSAYVFYHIPELDDPYIALDGGPKRRTSAGVGVRYPYSSWFVDKGVFEEWNNLVVNSERVRGLFAGHYHDWRRETYLSPRWLRTTDYSSGSLSKLYISPPVAVKRQQARENQARGFQEVMIDGAGAVNTKIWWFNAANEIGDTEQAPRGNELELGLFYERRHEWQQAETHFQKAAETASSDTVRNDALAGVTRTRDIQHPLLSAVLQWKMLSAILEWKTFALTGLLILAIIFLAWLALRQGYRAMAIHPFGGNDDLAKLLAFGFPATRAKIVRIIGGPNDALVRSVTGVYPFVFPHLDEMFPGQSFELMGTKVPDLNVFLRWINRPRFQVTGGISELLLKQYVYAEIWGRSWWFGTELVDHTSRQIPGGYDGRLEIENFIIDVYLRAHASLEVQRPDA